MNAKPALCRAGALVKLLARPHASLDIKSALKIDRRPDSGQELQLRIEADGPRVLEA